MTVAMVPGIALFVMVGRGASVESRRAVMFAGVASAGVGALGVEFTCPKTDALHLLVWHAGPVVAIPLTAVLAGAPLFARWLRRRQERRP